VGGAVGPFICAIVLVGCGGAGGPDTQDASASESGAPLRDAASAEASVAEDAAGLDASAVTVSSCTHPCPHSEPAVGDSCDFGSWCEYGGSPFVSCNQIYDCISGRVALDTSFASDAAPCPAALPSGCPASRTAITPGATCSASSLECPYADGECDCLLQGQGPATTWVCSGAKDGSQPGCPVPRAMLGTPCASDASVSSYCQYITHCAYEVCTSCGDQWGILFVPCGNGPPPANVGD
jgi:hypothetical protein